MKKRVLSSVAIAVLLMSGCSSKQPAVDQKDAQEESVVQSQSQSDSQSQNGGEAQDVVTEEVSSDMQTVGSESMESKTNEESMMQIQSKFQTIHFDFDKYNIRADQKPILELDAEVAKKAQNSFKIKLEGNCDEWGSDEYNFALGLKRTKSVKEGLVARGVSSEKITMVSYGESNPVCTEHTKECWAKNRRVDFKILP
ncbi:Outer membrane lipoprotein omp16 precursor [hydrothermal vent metagenome]|uniref:Outer membrane lipoprotein omp16 n=1 Tax=hydrothermal vent metagenome TaxID=652676 RepID=A0A1W1BSW5_9ZZZZ